jgi:centromeric protein E
MDEKSLIKKYQKEIQSLKHELEQVKRGIVEPNNLGSQDHLASLKQQVCFSKKLQPYFPLLSVN